MLYINKAQMKQQLETNSAEKSAKWREFLHALNPDIEPESFALVDQFMRVMHDLRRVGDKSLADAGLSFPKYRILLALMFSEKIDNQPELNPSEISRRQGTSRNTISSLVSDLENDELVERRLDQRDKRRFNIGLTDEGRALVRRHSLAHFQAVSSYFDGLAKSEQAELTHLLSRVGSRSADPDSAAGK